MTPEESAKLKAMLEKLRADNTAADQADAAVAADLAALRAFSEELAARPAATDIAAASGQEPTAPTE